MKELFVSYLYRVRHDIAFRITLFVGVGLSLLMALLYCARIDLQIDTGSCRIAGARDYAQYSFPV